MKKINLTSKEKNILIEIIESGRLSVGSRTDPVPEWFALLEKELSAVFESEHAVLFNSGTSSIHAALCAVGVNYCDEVITSPLTCYSAVLPISMCGGVPIFCDIDESTLSINLKDFKKSITENTKALLIPYMYGLPVPIKKFASVCRANELVLIEDCAHVPGLRIDSKSVGSFGDVSCFSFAQGKVLDCGEGGVALSNNKLFADEMNFFKEGGKREFRVYTPRGANNKMTNLQAFLAHKQLSLLETNLSSRNKIAQLYFSACNEKKSNKKVSCVNNLLDCVQSVALFKSESPARELILALREKDVDAKSIYKPINESNVFSDESLLNQFFNKDNKRIQVYKELNKKTPLAGNASTHYFYIETDPKVPISVHNKKSRIFQELLR